jgi:alpha-beta hydrolase superfamily lysophospholipase
VIAALRRPSRLRHGTALLAAPLVLGAAGAALLLVELSVRLTNPPGYVHPGPSAALNGARTTLGTDPMTELGLPYRSVEFPTSGEATLRGWLVPGTERARIGVVTAHGRGADRRDFLRHVPIFHDLGLPTLLFDYREHGTSDGAGRGMSMGFREARDISAAVRFLKETVGVERVVVVGGSLGGASAILAAAQDRTIDGVVAESPFASMARFVYDDVNRTVAHRPLLRPLFTLPGWSGLVVEVSALRQGVSQLSSPADVVHRIAPRPLLLMHGTGDVTVDRAHSELLYAKAGNPKELWIAEGAEHVRIFDRYPEEYRARISAFLHSISL